MQCVCPQYGDFYPLRRTRTRRRGRDQKPGWGQREMVSGLGNVKKTQEREGGNNKNRQNKKKKARNSVLHSYKNKNKQEKDQKRRKEENIFTSGCLRMVLINPSKAAADCGGTGDSPSTVSPPEVQAGFWREVCSACRSPCASRRLQLAP